jgi:hypothetical protein
MSFSEAAAQKTVLEVTLGETAVVEEITVPRFRRLEAVSGSRDEILSQLAALAGEDVWIEGTHTGDTVCPHLAADVYDAVKGRARGGDHRAGRGGGEKALGASSRPRRWTRSRCRTCLPAA